jgi:hypothetical protein
MVKTREQCEAMSNRELREYIRTTLHMGLGDAKNKEDLLHLIFGNPQTHILEKKETPCTILLDGIQTLKFTYPKGKTQKDLVNHLYDFFD